jgi:hypothetical protein
MSHSESNSFQAQADLTQVVDSLSNMSSQGNMLRPARRTNAAGIQADDTRICVVMVGLPARGKSYIAQKRKLLYLFPLSNASFFSFRMVRFSILSLLIMFLLLFQPQFLSIPVCSVDFGSWAISILIANIQN